MATILEIRKQAQLYLEGKSLREIGAIFGINQGIVHNNLTKELKELDLGLYNEVIDKINEKNAKKLTNPEVQKILLKEIELYLSGSSIEDIAILYNKSYDAVYHDLTQRIIRLHELMPETLPDQVVTIVRDLLKNNRLSNLSIGNNGAYKDQERDEKGKFSK